MKTSEWGIHLIEEFEGFRPTMYRDSVGLPTIGYGTLIDTEAEQWLLTAAITPEQAETLLKQELRGIESRMNKLFQKPINQNQYDSLASFCYNLGTGALKRSTLLKKLNVNPNDPAIRYEFMKWVNADGKRSSGLVKRRKAESDLYFTPMIDMT
jgi:lysozyme